MPLVGAHLVDAHLVSAGLVGAKLPGTLPGVADPNIWRYQVTPTAGYAHTPTITLWAGAPITPTWDWGDGSAKEVGVTMTHTYATAGTYTVTVTMAGLSWWIKTIDMLTDKVTGNFLLPLSAFTRLTSLNIGANAGLTGNIASLAPLTQLSLVNLTTTAVTGDISVFSRMSALSSLYLSACYASGGIAAFTGLTTLTVLYLNTATPTTITGNISSLAALVNLTSLQMIGTGVTGNISSLAALTKLTLLQAANTALIGNITDLAALIKIQTLYLYNTYITSGTIGTIVTMRDCRIYDCAWTQANVDAFLADLYANWAGFTYATPTLNIGGTNAMPGGIYQDGDPPTTGKEYIYEVVNDPEATGNEKWAITYSGVHVLLIGDSKTVLLPAPSTWSVIDPFFSEVPIRFATGGVTVANRAGTIDANIAAVRGLPEVIFINLGVNDTSVMPAEAVWKTDYQYILDALHVAYPAALIYLMRVWRRGYAAECNTLATWIADLVAASPAWVFSGPDERIFLENGDNGVTFTTDGIHPTAAGYILTYTEWLTAAGY